MEESNVARVEAVKSIKNAVINKASPLFLNKKRKPIGAFSDSRSNLQFADFAKMMAIDGKCNGQREHFRSPEKSPEHDFPILASLLPENTQTDARTKNSQQALQIQGGCDLWRLILPKEGHRTFIILLG